MNKPTIPSGLRPQISSDLRNSSLGLHSPLPRRSLGQKPAIWVQMPCSRTDRMILREDIVARSSRRGPRSCRDFQKVSLEVGPRANFRRWFRFSELFTVRRPDSNAHGTQKLQGVASWHSCELARDGNSWYDFSDMTDASQRRSGHSRRRLISRPFRKDHPKTMVW